MNETDAKTTSGPRITLSRVMEAAKYIPTLVSVMSALHTAFKIAQALRPSAPLVRIGSPRRGGRHVLGSLALVGAGVAVGTGLGIILAPGSGPKTLRRIRRRIDEIIGAQDRTSVLPVTAPPAPAPKNGTASVHHA